MMAEQEKINLENCPIRNVVDRIGDKWSLLVLLALAHKPTRFNELKREIGDISQKVLTKVLKELEQDGYVNRSVFDQSPPKVVYSLTELGTSLLKPMGQLIDWADTHHAAIKSNRKRYQQTRG